MWYGKEKVALDKNRAIFAERAGEIEVLLPQLDPDEDYVILGYNWFNIKTGKYTSCGFFRNISSALEIRSSWNLYNSFLCRAGDILE